MAPEVRFVPPGALALLLLSATPILAAPSPTQQNQPAKASEEKNGSVDAKARLLQELDRQIEERRRELAREEEELSAMKRALDASKQELLREKERLEDLKRDAEAAIAQRGKASDERLDQVAKVYAAMKPKEAALALEQAEDATAVAILERLPNRVVGKIFDLMSKSRVRDLTRRLEEGRASPKAR